MTFQTKSDGKKWLCCDIIKNPSCSEPEFDLSKDEPFWMLGPTFFINSRASELVYGNGIFEIYIE